MLCDDNEKGLDDVQGTGVALINEDLQEAWKVWVHV